MMNHNQNFYDSLDTMGHSMWRDLTDSPSNLCKIKEIINSIQHYYFSKRNETIRWIDVGCGRGDTFLIAQELGYEYYGIDCSSNNIEFCRRKYPAGNFLLGDFISLSELSIAFDLVTFISTLHHFEDWRAAIDKAFCTLQSGGVVYIEHEPTRLYATLSKYYFTWIKRVDAIMKQVEIHWFDKPSILPTDLPDGKVEFHCDFVPLVRLLGLHTRNFYLGRFLECYRKIMLKKSC